MEKTVSKETKILPQKGNFVHSLNLLKQNKKCYNETDEEVIQEKVLVEHHIIKLLLGLVKLLAILAERIKLSLPRIKLVCLSCLVSSRNRLISGGINEQLHSVYCIYLCADSM